jgi:hypothetical protein
MSCFRLGTNLKSFINVILKVYSTNKGHDRTVECRGKGIFMLFLCGEVGTRGGGTAGYYAKWREEIFGYQLTMTCNTSKTPNH